MICPKCGNEMPQQAKFCTFCGQNLTDEAFERESAQSENNQFEVNSNQYTQGNVNNSSQQYNQENGNMYSEPYPQPPVYPYAAPNPQFFDFRQNHGWTERKRPVKVSFIEAIKLYFKNYANFEGRSSVSEYWFLVLFNTLIGVCFNLSEYIVNDIYFSAELGLFISGLQALYSLATLIPSIAITVRRLHDIGKSGSHFFIAFIPIYGPIKQIINLSVKSQGDNEYGPGPVPDENYFPNMPGTPGQPPYQYNPYNNQQNQQY